MAITGQAKRDYQREYMREYMRSRRGSKQVKTQLRPVKTQNVLRPTKSTSQDAPQSTISLRPDTNYPPKSVLDELRAKTQDILNGQPQAPIVDDLPPFYNQAIHRPGDRVRVRQGAGWVIQVVPKLDADGNTIYE